MATMFQRLGHGLARTALRGRPDPLTSVVLTLPVFVGYHLGILLIDRRNGADLVTELTFRLLERSVVGYVGATLAVTVGLMAVVWVLRKRGHLRPADPAMVVGESLTWASIMLVTVGAAARRVTGALAGAPFGSAALATGGRALEPLDKLVMAAGAGFHEELVFRVLLVSGGAALLQRVLAPGRARALVAAVLVSSVAFALAHHLGPLGEPFAVAPLVFRTLAGVFLSAVYLVRGFAIAVYTHTLYDLLVFFVL